MMTDIYKMLFGFKYNIISCDTELIVYFIEGLTNPVSAVVVKYGLLFIIKLHSFAFNIV